jgi:hypothetical protein
MNPSKAATAPMRRKSGGKAPLPAIVADAPPADADERHDWIARAAYARASARGFVPGHELDDWLAAEAEFATRRGH